MLSHTKTRTGPCRGYDAFVQLIQKADRPVVLLEGSRDVPLEFQGQMEQLAARLMRTFPHLVARSGNADGSDQAWARGVNSVDPKRLDLVLPVPNYKGKRIETGNQALSLAEAPPYDAQAAKALTREHYVSGSNMGGTAYDGLPAYKKTYLDRDALKVLGWGDYRNKRCKAMAALFYLNPNKKHGGGTDVSWFQSAAAKLTIEYFADRYPGTHEPELKAEESAELLKAALRLFEQLGVRM